MNDANKRCDKTGETNILFILNMRKQYIICKIIPKKEMMKPVVKLLTIIVCPDSFHASGGIFTFLYNLILQMQKMRAYEIKKKIVQVNRCVQQQ